MESTVIKGFPGYTSDYIPMPNIAELMFMPFFNRYEADSFRNKCCDFQRELLDKTPLRHDKKHVIVDSYAVFVTPDTCFVGTRSGLGQLYEWHMDGFIKLNDPTPTYFHIIQTESTCPTIFNGDPIQVPLPPDCGIGRINSEATLHGSQWIKKEVPVEANRFVTFDKHLHRSSQAKEKTIRYFFRVTESDIIEPALEGSRPNPRASSFYHTTNWEGKSKMIESITHSKEGLFIHHPVPHLNGGI
jgi:hypothetical protein